MMFVFLVTALAPSLCLALGLKVMFELSAQALGAAALGLHFFATCSAVNASTSSPRRPQQRHNLPPFAPRQSIRQLETRCLPEGGITGRRIVRRGTPLAGVSTGVRGNTTRTIGNPFGNPSMARAPSLCAEGQGAPLWKPHSLSSIERGQLETLGEVCILGHIRFRTHTDAFRGHFRICTAEFHTYAFAVVAD